MKLEIIDKRKKDPRYNLLRYTLNYLTDDGKKGFINNKRYKDFLRRMPAKPFGDDTLQRVYKTLLYKRIPYVSWFWIYDEMKMLGYKGTVPVKPIINKRTERGIILYCSDFFINQNKNIFNEK